MKNSKNASSSFVVTSGHTLVAQLERGIRIGNIILTPNQSEELVRRAKKELSLLQQAELNGWLVGKQGYETLSHRTATAFARGVQIVLLDKAAWSEILAMYHHNK